MSSSVPTEICSMCLRTVKIIPTHLFPGFDKLCLLWKENAPTTNITIARCARGGASGGRDEGLRCTEHLYKDAHRDETHGLGKPRGPWCSSWGGHGAPSCEGRVHPLWPVTWRCDHRAERNLEETCLYPCTHTHSMVESLNLLNTEAWAHRIFHTLSLLIALIVNWQPL